MFLVSRGRPLVPRLPSSDGLASRRSDKSARVIDTARKGKEKA